MVGTALNTLERSQVKVASGVHSVQIPGTAVGGRAAWRASWKKRSWHRAQRGAQTFLA